MIAARGQVSSPCPRACPHHPRCPSERPLTHSLQVILLLTLVVASAKIAGALATRIHQPSVFGEILVGLLLGPTLFNVLGWPIFASPAGTPGVPLIDQLTEPVNDILSGLLHGK